MNETQKTGHTAPKAVIAAPVELLEVAAAPVVQPEPDVAIKEVMDLVSDWGEKSHLSGEAQLDAHNPEATQSECDYADFCQKDERTAWTAIVTKLRALLAGVSAPAQAASGELIESVDAWFAKNTGLGGCSDKDVAELAAIFAAPQAQADARDAEQEKPPAGRYVLAWMEGREIPIRAMWVPKSWLVAGDECPEGWAEYDEEKDEYYCPEGWYEANEHEETHWHVSTPIVAWADLPRRAAIAAQAAQQGGAA